MSLGSKHQQQNITYKDFTGGLNTTAIPELIAQNQLSTCINMELNKSTGALQTCCGATTIYKAPTGVNIDNLFYDKINNVFLYCDVTSKNVYLSKLVDLTGEDTTDYEVIGQLSGDLSPMAVMWENGLLIASGGRLQYWNGETLDEIIVTIEDDISNWEKLGSQVTNKVWTANTYYAVGAIVSDNSSYYECTTAHTSGTAIDTDKFTELTVHDSWEHETAYTTADVVLTDNKYYLCTTEHTSQTDAPEVCNGVFVKSGRVWIWYQYTLKCSGTGDERYWTDDSNDDSTSKYVDVGYKEGENSNAYILGVTSLSSDIIIIKADGKIYRLANEYPNWTLIEVARNVECLNRNSYCAIQEGVFILGRSTLFYLQSTVSYGDIEPVNIAVNVEALLNEVSIDDTKIKFIPSLNQIWLTMSSSDVLVYDLSFKAFTERRFNSRVTDIVSNYHDVVLLARSDKVTRLMNGIYKDEVYSSDESAIEWAFQARSNSSFNDFLLKRVRINYVPLLENFDKANICFGDGKIEIPLPEAQHTSKSLTDNTDSVTGNDYIMNNHAQSNTRYMVYRDRTLDMKGEGSNSAVILLEIDASITEV